jgi:hypothetical protein
VFRSTGGRKHYVTCFFELFAGFFDEIGGLVDLVLCLNYGRLGAEYFASSLIHGFACVSVRTKDAFRRRLRKPTSLTLPVGQLHSLVRMMRNYLTVKVIPQ